MKKLNLMLILKLVVFPAFIMFFLSTCLNVNNCKVNETVEETFNYHYLTALGVFQDDEITLNIKQALSIEYLSKVSGINHNLQFSDMVSIKNEDEFRLLMEDWKNWYNNHKCEISLSYSDSLNFQVEEYLKLY